VDQRLVTALIFGIVAVSIANILLSVGIVTLLAVSDRGTGSQAIDAGNVLPFAQATNNTMPVSGFDGQARDAAAAGMNQSAANGSTTPAATDAAIPSGIPVEGGFTSGQAPPSGWSGSGQMPPSGAVPGQMVTSGTGPTSSSGAGPVTIGNGQSAAGATQQVTGTGSIPSGTGTGSGPGGVSQKASATATPAPVSLSWFNNMTQLLGQLETGSQ